ncbi:hypothetical protein A3K71_00980 [archaeon RBG_16_50_20]|nr:MAG: hypothetical protein A3K71_00980 [archaeon RBG_16_50_20]
MWQWKATAGCLQRVWKEVLQRMRIHPQIYTSTNEHGRFPQLQPIEEGISTELIERATDNRGQCLVPHFA